MFNFYGVIFIDLWYEPCSYINEPRSPGVVMNRFLVLLVLSSWSCSIFAADNLCDPAGIEQMDFQSSGKSWKELLNIEKDALVFFDQTPLVNTARVALGKKITVITKDNPWQGVDKSLEAVRKVSKLGSSLEVIQLSWKPSEEWNKIAKQGPIKYNYLGKLFSSYCVGRSQSQNIANIVK